MQENTREILIEIRTNIAIMKNDLEHHIETVNKLRADCDSVKQSLKPVYQHVDRVEFIIKIIKWVGIGTILTLLSSFASR